MYAELLSLTQATCVSFLSLPLIAWVVCLCLQTLFSSLACTLLMGALCAKYSDDFRVGQSIEKRGIESQPNFYISDTEKTLLQIHFRETLLEQRPDFYHKVMLGSIIASPKMNEIIACQQFCMRDLTTWPKLNRISQAQKSFIDSLIYSDDLQTAAMVVRIRKLNHVHAGYLKYGFKPQFLDLWRQKADDMLEKLNFGDDLGDKEVFVKAMRALNDFVVDIMHCSTPMRQNA